MNDPTGEAAVDAERVAHLPRLRGRVVQRVTAISAQEPSGSVPVDRLVAILTGRRV